MSKAKWFVPILVIVAMLAAVGIVWSQSSSGGSVGDLGQLTDQNPAYDDQIVTPPDAGSLPAVLYSITMDPPTSTVPMLGGTVATIVLTNLIPAAINNGPVGAVANSSGILVPVMAYHNGDITGDLVVTADIYNTVNTAGCLAVYGATGTSEGKPDQTQAVVKIYKSITVHPGMTVSFQVPIGPGFSAVPGAEFMLKAQLVETGTEAITGGLLTGFTPWTAGDAGCGP